MVSFSRDWITYIDSMHKEMERLLGHFASSKPPMVQFSPRMWEPAIDVYETEEQVVVLIELAGVRLEDIDIVVDGNSFVVRGERRIIPRGNRPTYYQMEISNGSFERVIILPASVDLGKTKASYQDGLVEVILPKVEEEHTFKVKVKGT